MTTITQKRKLSKGAWALIIIVAGAVIAVGVLAAVGYISLAFLADALVAVMDFGSLTWMNATIILVGSAAAGGLFVWLIYRYFVGQKVTTATIPGTNYVGQSQISQPTQKDTETVVS